MVTREYQAILIPSPLSASTIEISMDPTVTLMAIARVDSRVKGKSTRGGN